MDDVIGGLIQLACIVIFAFGGLAAAVGYILWEKKKKDKRSAGRAALGQPLGLGVVHAHGGQDRLGGQRNGRQWSIGWEVRKIAGGPPSFVTFFECHCPLPQAELRLQPAGRNVEVSGVVGPAQATGHAGLDARFVASGDVQALAAAGDAFVRLASLGEDLYLLPDRLVLVCSGDHSEPAFLKERVEAMERLVDGLP